MTLHQLLDPCFDDHTRPPGHRRLPRHAQRFVQRRRLRQIAQLGRTRGVRNGGQHSGLDDRPQQHVGRQALGCRRRDALQLGSREALPAAARHEPLAVALQAIAPLTRLDEHRRVAVRERVVEAL